jgi:cytochrome c biogenesis protein CcmG/thiol:disulfide interchange protein DsbE
MTRKQLIFIIPVLLFVVLVGFLAVGLKLDPREVPSPLIGKPAPDFTLPVLDEPGKTITPADFRGQVWLLNVWASWCSGCRVEHDLLLRMTASGDIMMVGMDYKDEVADARNWLRQLGNPYQLVVVDADGKAGIDWGVYGVPETFVIDKQGIVRHKHIGPVTEEAVRETILPMVRQLEAES